MREIEERQVRKIQYSSLKRQQYVEFKRVNRGKTNSLNINTKSINQQFLRKLFPKVTEESKIVENYVKMKSNFNSTRQLFGIVPNQTNPQLKRACENIRLKMIQVYQSKLFMEFVLKNEKMDLNSKIIILAYLQQIRKSALCPNFHHQWKLKL